MRTQQNLSRQFALSANAEKKCRSWENTRVFETQNTKFGRRFGPFLVSRQLLLFCLLYMPPSRRFTADAADGHRFFFLRQSRTHPACN